MEKIILERLTYYLNSNDLLSIEQYGFKRGHSTADQILYFGQRVRDSQNLRPSHHTVAVFLDLSKAFDRVWRNKLIIKLFNTFGIRDRALSWIFDFLKDREIRILSNKHIDYVINKGRKRLDLLKYIAGRDWGADAGTLRLTYTSLIRPVLEYGSQIYFSASRTNLAKLDRVQSSAARIITGMRHSCPTDLVLFEADIMPLDLRRKLLLSKYFCKLYSYGDYNRTSAYLITWTNRHRLKRDSPFSRMQAMDLLDQDIEEHFLKNVFNPQEGLPRVHFKPEMGAHTSKNQDPPEYLRQLALEIINKIPATAMQIYTDGSKDEQNSCGSGIFIKAPNCSHNIKIRIRTFVLFLDPS
ncbi:putative RNA-directed DNA polymerase from transposon BS [Trichonephila clavipes]|nr:putative RNA-directed DNA polymerase from transposon BS [Trichonephila clavipes]